MMLVKRKLSEVPKNSTVYYLDKPFVSRGCVDDLALLSSLDNRIHITLPADTELDYESNMEALVNKLQNEMEEYEGRLADLLDKENAQTAQDSVRILGGRLTSWFIKRSILGHFTYEALYCEYDVDREIRNQKLLKVKDLLHRLYVAYDDIDTEVELAIPSVIEKAIERVLEEECTDD